MHNWCCLDQRLAGHQTSVDLWTLWVQKTFREISRWVSRQISLFFMINHENQWVSFVIQRKTRTSSGKREEENMVHSFRFTKENQAKNGFCEKNELIWRDTYLEISLKVFYTNKVTELFDRTPLANRELQQCRGCICGHSYRDAAPKWSDER